MENQLMTLITQEVGSLIGIWSEAEIACDPVEQGAVRRFAQAIMDDDPSYADNAGMDTRYGGPIAPPLFPNHMLRRGLGVCDPVQERAGDPDFDGVMPTIGLPQIMALAHLPILNGGSEFEFFRYVRHGESVCFRQRYAEIFERVSSKGTLVVVVIEGEIRTTGGEPLLKSRRTLLRRSP